MVSYDQVDSTCVCHAAFPPAEPYQDGVEQVSPTVQQDCTQTTKTRTSGTHTLKYSQWTAIFQIKPSFDVAPKQNIT